MPKVWINGERHHRLDPLDRGLAYGDGLFATMRIAEGKIAFLSEHLERLSQGAKRLGMPWSASSQLILQLEELAAVETCGCIKLLLSRGCGGRGYAAPEPCDVTEVVSVHDFPRHYKHWQQVGIAITTSPIKLSTQPRLAGIKHLNRLEQVLIKSEPIVEGYDDWLVLDAKNNVVESSMANLFFVNGTQIVTPSMSLSGVAGMMREQIIYALIDSGFALEARPITHSSLSQFQHAFMTNSLLGLIDINKIDDLDYARASFTETLRRNLHLIL